MQAMRHSDPRLTAITYNDANLMPVGDAISKLPSISIDSQYSPIHSPKMFSGCQNVSQGVSQDLRKKFDKDTENQEGSLDLSHYDAECQKPVVAPAVGFEPTT